VDKLYNLWNRNPTQVKASYLSSGGKSDIPAAPNLASY
jgi:3',5'-cyclic-AMP phosphodiesterase